MHQAENSMNTIATEASLKPEVEKIDADIRALLEQSSADPHSAATPAAESPAPPPVVVSTDVHDPHAPKAPTAG